MTRRALGSTLAGFAGPPRVLLVALLVSACGSAGVGRLDLRARVRRARRPPDRPRRRPLRGSAAPGSPAASPSGSGANGSASPSGSPAPSAATAYLVLRGRRPVSTTFECVTLAVPKDHFAAAGGETWDDHVRHPPRDAARGRGPTSRSPAARATATSPTRTATSTTTRPRSPRPTTWSTWTSAASGGPARSSARRRLPRTTCPRHGRRSRPSATAAAGAAAETFATDCIAEAGVGRGGPPLLRDDAGGRGPRGRPRLPRRRQDGPVRAELRHPVRPDLRGRASRSHRDALRRRPGGPHGRRPDLLRRGGALGGGHPRSRPSPPAPPTRRARPTWPAETPSRPTTPSPTKLDTGPLTFDFPTSNGHDRVSAS